MIKKLVDTPVSGRAAAIAASLNKRTTNEAYEKGMNLSRYLETLDPSKDHKDGTDAFNRVLRSMGFVTRSIPELGIQATELGQVIDHERGQYLALEIIARAYRAVCFGGNKQRALSPSVMSGEGVAGTYLAPYVYPAPRDLLLEPAIPLSTVVSRTTGINSTYFKPFFLEDVTNANSRVSEAAEIPAVRIGTSDKLINLKKYGRRIDITYEALRRIPIDLLSFYIQRIAIAVEAEKLDKVMDVIVNGDGNSGTAATNYNLTALDAGTTANNLTLRAWLAFKMKFKNPLVLTTVLSNEAPMLNLMLLNSGSANIPLVSMGPLGAAQSITPINAGLRDGVQGGWLDSAPANKLVGFDSRLSVERLFEVGGNIQEEDQDVKSQLKSVVLSEVEGYSILDPKANKTLSLNA